MTDHQQAAIEAAEDALRADIWDGDPEDIPPTMEREAELAVAAAEPHLRRKWAEELVERIGASNLGAPLRIDPDGTFRMANGPEMRALLCEFILEAARRAR